MIKTIEVQKCCTNRKLDIGNFSDAITNEGSKHLLNLKESIKRATNLCLIFNSNSEV